MHAAPLRRFGGSVLAFAGIVVGGCTYEPTPALPDGAVSFTAPTAYVTWWDKTTGCSELPAA
jgi:hypothetical protein